MTKDTLIVICIILVIASRVDKVKFRGIRKNKEDKNGNLYGHGVRTLANGVDNLFPINILLLLLINLISLINIDERILIPVIIFSIDSSLYRISEIKHLSDGVSTDKESDKFYTYYASWGVVYLICNICVLSCLEFTVSLYILIILMILLIFILGMGDCLQLTGINDCNNKRYRQEQSFKFFTEIPVNIIECTLNKKERIKFYIRVNKNIKYIIKGIRKAFNE